MPIDSDPDTPNSDAADHSRETPARPTSQDAQEMPHEPQVPDDRNSQDGMEGPDVRQRQIAENVRYSQVVDAAYQAASTDAWARAVPELRASWEDHKRRYPEGTHAMPRTQADGSWVAEGNRHLSPEQNAEASKCCADLRDEADRVILPAMRRVEAADPERHLAGLEHMVKGEDRLKEKIADYVRAPGATIRRAVDMVPDAVRFTLTYDDTGRYADGVLADVELLKSEGFELIKLKNLWQADQYKGVNSQWRRPDTGLRFEVQFHTPQSLEAKELTHDAYERIRGKAISAAEERDLEEFQRRANVLLAAPPGINRIKDFQE